MCKNIGRGLITGLQPVGCGDTVGSSCQPTWVPQTAKLMSVHGIDLAFATPELLSLQSCGQQLFLTIWCSYKSIQCQAAGLITFCSFPAVCLGGTCWQYLHHSPFCKSCYFPYWRVRATQAGTWPGSLIAVFQHLASLESQEVLVEKITSSNCILASLH